MDLQPRYSSVRNGIDQHLRRRNAQVRFGVSPVEDVYHENHREPGSEWHDVQYIPTTLTDRPALGADDGPSTTH